MEDIMENKIIIVEGIDRVGKTTLCDRLSKELQIEIQQRPKGDGTYDFSKLELGDVYAEEAYMLSQFRKEKKSVILDRFHLSEYIFGEYLRKYDRVNSIRFFNFVDYMAMKANAILICVKPTSLQRSSEEDGKDLSAMQASFETIFRGSIIRNKYTASYDTFDQIVQTIKEL